MKNIFEIDLWGNSEKFKKHFWIKLVYFLLLISLPFSIPYQFENFQINLLSEPLMILLVVLIIPSLWKTRIQLKSVWNSPLLICSVLWISWMCLSVFWSVDSIVSAKYSLVAFVHWLLFGYGLIVLKLNPFSSINRWFNLYTFPLIIILFFAWWNHAQYQFRMDASVLVARPFYFDHALLGVCLLLLIGIYFSKTIIEMNNNQNDSHNRLSFFYGLIIVLFLIGVYLSFSRAAWVSAILSCLIILSIVFFKMNFNLMVIVYSIGFVMLLFFIPLIFQSIEKNETESKKGNWLQQMASVTNINTDVSNLERLNRYSCAWRMFLDKPVFGFGAGTFPTSYLPYQKPNDMTRISVTTSGPHPPGRGGGTHSEYLQALSEMGILGGLLFLSLLISSFWTSIQIYWKGNFQERILALGLLFGLLTYFIHGMFNNFFHHGKIAILVWSSMAILINLKCQMKN